MGCKGEAAKPEQRFIATCRWETTAWARVRSNGERGLFQNIFLQEKLSGMADGLDGVDNEKQGIKENS